MSVSVLCTYIAVDMVMLCYYYTNRRCIVDYTELYVKLSDIQQRIYNQAEAGPQRICYAYVQTFTIGCVPGFSAL